MPGQRGGGVDPDGLIAPVAADTDRALKRAHGLRIEIDYARVTAGMTPFAIGDVIREPVGDSSYRWNIEINWPAGEITFEAPRFTMELTGDSVISGEQLLHRS